MRKLLIVPFFAGCLMGQITTYPQAPIPFASLVQSAGSDCIFALHTDTITGMSCANTSVDGTTETAFTNGVLLRANTLSSNTMTLASTFLLHTSAGAPSITMSLRYGGIGGTQVWKSPVLITSNNANYAITIQCTVTAVNAASVSTGLVVACSNTNGLTGATLGVNTLLSNTTQSIAADVTTDKTLVWTVTYSVNTANNAIGLYTMFNGIR